MTIKETALAIADELETLHCGHEKDVWETFSGNVRIRDKVAHRLEEILNQLMGYTKEGT